MNYLKSTQYVFSVISILLVAFMRPVDIVFTTEIICAICASLMIGRGLIQMNTGTAGSAWKSAEFQFFLIGVGFLVYAYARVPEATVKISITLALLIGVFNVSRGIAEWYKAVNPLILR